MELQITVSQERVRSIHRTIPCFVSTSSNETVIENSDESTIDGSSPIIFDEDDDDDDDGNDAGRISPALFHPPDNLVYNWYVNNLSPL